jgi:phage gp36-like protein
MAAYCTLIDLKNYLPETVLLQLSDDPDVDTISQEKIDFAVKQASDLIDSYLRGRYSLPLTVAVPDLIVDICVKLSTYFLFKRSLILTLPEPVHEDYKYSMTVLRDIQLGRVSPFEVSQNPVWFRSNKSRGSPSVVTTATNNWNDYLVRSTGTSAQRFFNNPGSL